MRNIARVYSIDGKLTSAKGVAYDIIIIKYLILLLFYMSSVEVVVVGTYTVRGYAISGYTHQTHTYTHIICDKYCLI